MIRTENGRRTMNRLNLNKVESMDSPYFNLKQNAEHIMMMFTKDFGHQNDGDFHYNALDFILPRSNLLFGLSYDSAEFELQHSLASEGQRSRDIHSLRQECGNSPLVSVLSSVLPHRAVGLCNG